MKKRIKKLIKALKNQKVIDLRLTKNLIFLLGILTGILIQRPYILWLQRTPVVVAELVPDSVYNQTPTRKFTIGNVPSWVKIQHNNTLRITITSQEEVDKEAKRRFPLSSPNELLGFYDPVEHDIWCVNNTDVLIHELRHVFEGVFHRAQ